jgi:hypothetical protein
MSLLRRIRRNTHRSTLNRQGHTCTIGYAKRALAAMVRGLRALSRSGHAGCPVEPTAASVQGTAATPGPGGVVVAPGEGAE